MMMMRKWVRDNRIVILEKAVVTFLLTVIMIETGYFSHCDGFKWEIVMMMMIHICEDNRILILEKAAVTFLLDFHSANDLLLLKGPAINMNSK